MARFRYQHGERPLDGFTIEHGLGVGGFGEVYYAVSDAGREVALKAVQNYQEVELRGIRHCMNLKSPHLVTIFDVKHNERTDPFVVMEYVRGPSLRNILDENPEGLGTTKAAFFLREIAKGLSYLHEAGVVHRDLKPHNVFYEDGFVKIGDYSLCKLISTTHHTGHTMTVGTVHYMAPEVSKGHYNSSVDIYALGAMLYEMLTGYPPFMGQSVAEVLMKHLNEEPDLSNIEEPFRTAVTKALAKDPESRFQSVEDMVAAIFGSEHVENSVIAFNPCELTLVAQKMVSLPSVAGHPQTDGASQLSPPPPPASKNIDAKLGEALTESTQHWKEQFQTASGILGWRPRTDMELARDRMPAILRYGLATLAVCAFGGFATAAGSDPFLGHDEDIFLWVASLAGTAILSFSFVRQRLLRNIAADSQVLSRLVVDTTLTLMVIPIGMGIIPMLIGLQPGREWDGGATTLLLALLPFGIVNCHAMTQPQRNHRLSFVDFAMTVGIGFVIALFAMRMNQGVSVHIAPCITAAIALGLQLTSPWQKLPSTRKDEADRNIANQTIDSQAAKIDISPPVLPRPAAVPDYASPFARWPLVILASIFFFLPIAGGLHRFYVGKRSSGLIWLLSMGLFGVGQIWDLICILRGRFYDAQGRPVLAWETSQAPSTPVNDLSSVPAEGHAAKAVRQMLSIVGNVFFTISAALAGIALVVRFAWHHSPSFVEEEFAIVFGIVSVGALILSTGLIFASERNVGIWRRLRLLGAAGVVGIVAILACSESGYIGIPFILLLPPAILYATPLQGNSDGKNHLSAATEQQEALV